VRKRRLLLGMLGTGMAAPRLLFAQAPKVVNVAVLFPGESDDDERAAKPFFDEMARLGWEEGRNIAYDRHASKGARPYLESLVGTAVGRTPDLIFATTASLAAATLKETKTLPVVFATASDPVAGGLVASLAKPGANATGIYHVPGEAAPKRYALVRQLLPAKQKRLGAVFDRNALDWQSRKASHEKAARGAGFELVPTEFTNFEAVAKLFAQYKRDGVAAVEITPSFSLIGRRREVTGLADRNGIALVAHRAEWADAGALMTFGVDIALGYRRAAGIVNRVLKGQSPAAIAVERANRWELVVNQRVATALGITIPKGMQQQASRVIT
jgi:putative ABC transport system substrate-binding protein